MITIKSKYIILFWILLLILFTFYCIFRLKYISKNIQEKYFNIVSPTSSNSNVFDWISNIEKQDKITDVSDDCKNVFDDNIRVGDLGYSDCQTAYNDYVNKGYDVNDKFGQSQSLADICPVSSKSLLYSSCLDQLLFKFTNSSNIIDTATSNLTNSLNDRLDTRSKIVNDVDTVMKPFINSKDQTDFTNFMKTNNSIAQYPDDVFKLVGNYYENRFKSSYNIGYKESFEGFTSNTTIITPNIESVFFGYYTPLSGQFLALDDITISLNYDNEQNSDSLQLQKNTKQIMLTIKNTKGTQISSNVDTINNFKGLPNAVILKLSSIIVTNDPNNSQTIQQLLSILGLNELSYLILIYEEYTSTENMVHITYKLANENLDTILLLNKLTF